MISLLKLVLFLIPAGFLAGISSSAAGLASLVSYPALLMVGLPPVMANVTNTYSLLASGFSSIIAINFRRDFRSAVAILDSIDNFQESCSILYYVCGSYGSCSKHAAKNDCC